MKYLKIIVGALFAVTGLTELLKVIYIYFTSPVSQWPAGAEIGTLGFIIGGYYLCRSGLKHGKATTQPVSHQGPGSQATPWQPPQAPAAVPPHPASEGPRNHASTKPLHPKPAAYLQRIYPTSIPPLSHPYPTPAPSLSHLSSICSPAPLLTCPSNPAPVKHE